MNKKTMIYSITTVLNCEKIFKALRYHKQDY